MIGTWGRALAHFNAVKGENVVALCDVDARYLGKAVEKFPGAKTFRDYRELLDFEGLDAVVYRSSPWACAGHT